MGVEIVRLLRKMKISTQNILFNLLVLTALPRLETARLQKRSDLAVAPATGYLPAEEEYEDLPGYSPDTFSLPGYGDDNLARQAPGVEEEVESTTVGLETTTLSGGLEETTTAADDLTTTEISVAGDDSEDGDDDEPEDGDEEKPEDDGEDEDEDAGEEGVEDVGPSEAFSKYSSLSPSISLCPGSKVEVCVSVSPGTSPRVYSACVQGCADRCPQS